MKNKGLKIPDLRNAMLVSTFFFLWLAVYFSHSVEEVLAFVLIFSFGILHGANDLEILRRRRFSRRSKKANTKLLLAYVGWPCSFSSHSADTILESSTG